MGNGSPEDAVLDKMVNESFSKEVTFEKDMHEIRVSAPCRYLWEGHSSGRSSEDEGTKGWRKGAVKGPCGPG